MNENQNAINDLRAALHYTTQAERILAQNDSYRLLREIRPLRRELTQILNRVGPDGELLPDMSGLHHLTEQAVVASRMIKLKSPIAQHQE